MPTRTSGSRAPGLSFDTVLAGSEPSQPLAVLPERGILAGGRAGAPIRATPRALPARSMNSASRSRRRLAGVGLHVGGERRACGGGRERSPPPALRARGPADGRPRRRPRPAAGCARRARRRGRPARRAGAPRPPGSALGCGRRGSAGTGCTAAAPCFGFTIAPVACTLSAPGSLSTVRPACQTRAAQRDIHVDRGEEPLVEAADGERGATVEHQAGRRGVVDGERAVGTGGLGPAGGRRVGPQRSLRGTGACRPWCGSAGPRRRRRDASATCRGAVARSPGRSSESSCTMHTRSVAAASSARFRPSTTPTSVSSWTIRAPSMRSARARISASASLSTSRISASGSCAAIERRHAPARAVSWVRMTT